MPYRSDKHLFVAHAIKNDVGSASHNQLPNIRLDANPARMRMMSQHFDHSHNARD